MPDFLRGTVVKVYFTGPAFSAGMLETESGERVKFKGKLQIAEGEPLAAEGVWEEHPKFGRQFSAKCILYDLPESKEGLIRYLAGHSAFKGIGEATARRMVEYAESTADSQGIEGNLDRLIRNGLQELRSHLRIPLAALETLQIAWIKNAAENKARSYLSGFELTSHQIDTLLEKFRENVISVLKTDPYQLIRCVKGYGFKRVDDIARKMGIPKDHPGRIKAGVLHTVHEEIDNGHTWIGAGELVRKANDLLILDSLDSLELIRKIAKELVDAGELAADGQAVTIPDMLQAEQTIADAFALAGKLAPAPIAAIHRDTSGLNSAQVRAYHMCLDHTISALSGLAGCGKTHCIGRLAKTWRAAGKTIVLCAPTGKAAKRIEEVLRTKHGFQSIEAKTIHRLLGYDGHAFHIDRIEADVVLVDECSMIDVPLMAELLKRIDLSRTQVVLVGDHNQLPPVGPGNILRDIITHKLVPITILDRW